MNRISKLLSILALFSFGLSTEKSEEEAIENKVSIEENKSEDVSVNEETPAIDIERVSQIRQTKARLDNKHAQRVLHSIKTSQKISEKIRFFGKNSEYLFFSRPGILLIRCFFPVLCRDLNHQHYSPTACCDNCS